MARYGLHVPYRRASTSNPGAATTMTTPQTIAVTRIGAVNVVRIDRPEKKNALTSAMYEAMTAALRAGEADDGVAVHVLLGVPGAFSTGNDIAEFAAAAATGKLGLQVIDFLMALANLDKPLVIGVDGLAIGIGTTALLHADLVYASDRSLFRTPFLDLGLVPEGGSSLLAPRLMGHPLAFELLCLGNGFDAARAAAVGMVNRVVTPDEVEPVTLAAAETLAAKPRQALAAARRLLRTGHVTSREEVLTRIAEEAKEFSRRLASPEAAAAFAAFMGKKK